MFDRFTDRARRVVVFAQREAGLLNHNYVGTEHILLGLVREGDGVAAQVLLKLGAELHQVRQTVIQLLSGSSGEVVEEWHHPAARPNPGAWRSEGLVTHIGSPPSSGFVGVVNGGRTPFGVVGALGTVFVLVAIVAVLADHPLSNLAGAGLIMLIGGVVAATVGVVVVLLSSAPGIRGERVVRWSAAVALVLFAAGAVLIGLDSQLA